GIRPGERLYEELALQDESAKKTRHPKIFIGRLQPVDWEDINRDVEDLQILADCPDTNRILHKLKEIVPEFEGSEVASPHGAAWMRSDSEHAVAGWNGNGTASANDAAKQPSVSRRALKSSDPLPH